MPFLCKVNKSMGELVNMRRVENDRPYYPANLMRRDPVEPSWTITISATVLAVTMILIYGSFVNAFIK